MGILDKIDAARGKSLKSFVEPNFWEFDSLRYPFLSTYASKPDEERIDADFQGYVTHAFKANGIVFSLIAARQMVFSEARFLWRERRNGRPGDLFGNAELALLERPWPGGTTGELLSRMELTASLAGNYWATTADDNGRLGKAATGPGRRIVHMRPDWTTIVIGSHSGDPNALDAKPVGVLYEPRNWATAGVSSPTNEAVLLLPDEVVHYSPLPDPEARFRGMSWITPVLREIQADTASTIHKQKFLENAATPNMVVKFDATTAKEDFDAFVERFEDRHRGAWNAYKTLFLAGGADVTVVGKDFQQLEFAATQGKGESRLASAAGVPPSWVGFSEGLQGSALNAGNFGAARRRFADGTIRPLWRIATASLQVLLTPPSASAELCTDTRDIAFLREDQRDSAEISRLKAATIRQYIDTGFHPDAAVTAVRDEDISLLLGKHSGLYSVQLQPPGTEATPSEPGRENEVPL